MDHFEFNQFEQKLVDRYSRMKLPMDVCFELTPYCNMSCKMCYVHETKCNLPLLRKDAWLDFGRQAKALGALFVLLTGGEPLVHPDFKDIYLGLKEEGMIITLNSNGTLIDEEMADFFAKYPPRRINLSLYGPSDDVYSELCGCQDGFTKVKRGIELLLGRNVAVKINIIANKMNYPYLEEMYQFCASYGLDVEANSYLFEPLRLDGMNNRQYQLSPEEMADANLRWDMYRLSMEEFMVRSVVAHEALTRYVKPHSCEGNCIQCRAGSSSFWLCWDGFMTPCVNILKPRINVPDHGIEKAWQYIVEEVSRIRISGKCNSCSLRQLCQTCAAVSLHENGSFGDVPQIICDATMEQAKRMAAGVSRHLRQVEAEEESL